MVQQFGSAAPVTCPACGVGAASGLCTLTRGEIVTLRCAVCGLQVRDGIVLEHGIDIDPDEIREMADRHPEANPREWFIAPEARPLLLVPTDRVSAGEPAPGWPPISAVTVRFARRGAEADTR